MTPNNCSEMSPMTRELRQRLDKLHIPWLDKSEIAIKSNFSELRFERTKIYPWPKEEGSFISAIYVYDAKLPDSGYSFGYPDCIEVWCLDWALDPEPYELDEFIRRLADYTPSFECEAQS